MAGNVKVTVTEGYAVAVDGRQHGGGQTLNVDRDTADHWIASGWATAADTTTKPSQDAQAEHRPATAGMNVAGTATCQAVAPLRLRTAAPGMHA